MLKKVEIDGVIYYLDERQYKEYLRYYKDVKESLS